MFDFSHVVDLPATGSLVNSSDVLQADVVSLDHSDCQTIQLPDGTVAVIRKISKC